MGGAGDLRHLESRVQFDAHLHRVALPPGRVTDGRRDPLRIGHLRRFRDDDGVDQADLRLGAGDVAWADDQGKAQAERAVVVAQGLVIAYLDGDPLSGSDVGDGRGEHVGPFLLDQGGPPSRLPGFLVCSLCLLALPDLAHDDTPADQQPHVIDGGVVGQGKDVNALLPFVVRIEEVLNDPDPGHHAVDPNMGLGGKVRRRDEGARCVGPEQKPAAPHFARLDGERVLAGHRHPGLDGIPQKEKHGDESAQNEPDAEPQHRPRGHRGMMVVGGEPCHGQVSFRQHGAAGFPGAEIDTGVP